MTCEVGIKILADSAGRALESVVSKFKICKDLGYFTYSQLYDAYVCPMLLGYGASKSAKYLITQDRVAWCFLGVHKFAPSLAAQGYMGWIPRSVT